MSNSFKPYKMTTIPEVISAGKALGISESTMAFKTVIDNEFAIAVDNVITRYMNIVKNYIETIELPEDEFIKFKNKPGYYCYIQYGTPELMSSLLYINNMVSITEFTKPKFKRFNSNIMKLINELMSLNELELKRNRIENKID